MVGPVIPLMAFHRAGPVRRGLGMRWVGDPKRFGQFEPREVRADAVVPPAAEVSMTGGSSRVMSRRTG